MQEKSLIKKNILQFLEIQGISKYKFYQETGITRGVLDQNNGMSEENTAKFLAYYPNINPEWLLTGKGEMLKSEEKSKVTQHILGHNNTMAGNDLITDNSLTIKILMQQIEDCKRIIEEKDTQINKLLNLMSYEKK